MDRTNQLDVEWNLESAQEYLKKWKPPEPEMRRQSIKSWDKLMEDRIYHGHG